MKKLSTTLAFGLALGLFLPAADAGAQRRVIGAEPSKEEKEEAEKEKEEEQKKKDPKAAEEEKKKKEAAKKKKEEARKKKEEAKKRKEEAKKAAEEAAEKAAEEAERKKQEAIQKKKEAAERKEKERLEKNRSARLKRAKAIRKLTRDDSDVVIGIALAPGAPKAAKVQEVRLELNQTLKVAHPKYGNRKPLVGMRVTATVEEPATEKGSATTTTYVVHPLDAPGSYGFHHTPTVDGEYSVRLDGRSADNEISFSATFPMHVGTWPPPDFDDEEATNAKNEAGRVAGGRRVVGSN
jgi:hypothetical protein